MKIYSWNVNGFRAVIKKGFWDWLNSCKGDIVLIQEIKAEISQIPKKELEKRDGYNFIWNSSKKKKGYSGVAVFYKNKPIRYSLEFPEKKFAGEGRVIELEYDDFYLFNIYFPNGQMSEERLKFKLDFYDYFLDYVEKLRKNKPIIVGGDFNTAHTEIDLANPKENSNRSGFLPIERAWIDKFIATGYVDTFRIFDKSPGKYTWWSYRFNARKKNIGWRIDYFFVSKELLPRVKNAWIEDKIMGSDHCPIGLEIE